MEVILVRYGEIALKGRNRANFENRLRDNIARSVEGKINKIPGRLILYPEDTKKAVNQLKKIFGIVSVSVAREVELEIDKINRKCLAQAKAKKFSTFRITVQRSLKKLKPSPELEKDIGAYILENTGKEVKLKKPDLEISVEISDRAYVFTDKIKCIGGLPAGIEGKVVLLIEDRKSILAGLLAMKRGCSLVPVTYKKTDAGLLEKYGCNRKPIIIKDMGGAEETAEKNSCRAIVVGQQLRDIKDLGTDFPLLRPLVGISPKKAEKILMVK